MRAGSKGGGSIIRIASRETLTHTKFAGMPL